MLVLVESTDVVFAVDSVPAVLAVAREQFIVFSSNAFAILGLRSMYFLLAGAKDRFRYLNVGLGIILASVGIKMLLSDFVHLPAVLSLGIIVVVLAGAISFSLAADRRDARTAARTRGKKHSVAPERGEGSASDEPTHQRATPKGEGVGVET